MLLLRRHVGEGVVLTSVTQVRRLELGGLRDLFRSSQLLSGGAGSPGPEDHALRPSVIGKQKAGVW